MVMSEFVFNTNSLPNGSACILDSVCMVASFSNVFGAVLGFLLHAVIA